eukprot:CAMPEP_0194049198 /NCGR_PEP_ID=MMETSP0009_2-20130614/29990_1 /TAXON_ID=210454 /ORGANISM="Grammatophora oceanica, Strain CCMP 410" /LENGTH=220 /DNA_ID=CAMNT_0038695291 /DNA_START=139 /DNA_END=801 /DNA_ORIENTATION=-
MEPDDREQNIILRSGGQLSASSLLSASPTQQGRALKLHVPVLYTLLPSFIQNFIRNVSFLAFLGPTWSERLLVLCGSYVYKFVNESSKAPKGSPLPVDVVNVSLVQESTELDGVILPVGYKAIFQVSTLRKKQYYAVPTKEEAMIWITSLQDARQEAIRRSMGHAANMPYPKSWSYFDTLAVGLVKSKDRIRQRLEEQNMREMELSSLTDGGPIGRGYFG